MQVDETRQNRRDLKQGVMLAVDTINLFPKCKNVVQDESRTTSLRPIPGRRFSLDFFF